MANPRRPMGRRHKPDPPPPEAPDYGPEPLYAVHRNGRRVYLPPVDAPGIKRDEADRLVRQLGESAEAVEVYGGHE